jgi:hypothetical protein
VFANDISEHASGDLFIQAFVTLTHEWAQLNGQGLAPFDVLVAVSVVSDAQTLPLATSGYPLAHTVV